MENESTFVAPEGVYSLTEEHKPILAQSTLTPVVFPTKVSSIVVRAPPVKPQGGGPPGLAQLLGGNKDGKKDKKDDGHSLSSSETPDEIDQLPSVQENGTPATPSLPEQQTIFSSGAAGRKKQATRPKHNMRTTSSTFVTRIQTGEGWSKTLQSKQGDLTILCYNVARTFLMVEAGSKAKVISVPFPSPRILLNMCAGTSYKDRLFRPSNVPRHQSIYRVRRAPRRHHWLQHR